MPNQGQVKKQMSQLIHHNFFIATFYHATRRTLESFDLDGPKMKTALKACRNIYNRYKDTDDAKSVQNAITYIFRKIKDELELDDDIKVKFETEFKESMKSNVYYHIYGVGMHTDIKAAEQQLDAVANDIWNEQYNQKLERELWGVSLGDMEFSNNPYTPMWYKCVLSFSTVGTVGLGTAIAIESSFFDDTFQSIGFYQCLGLTVLLLLSAYLLYSKGNDYYYPGIQKEIDAFQAQIDYDKLDYYDVSAGGFIKQDASSSC